MLTFLCPVCRYLTSNFCKLFLLLRTEGLFLPAWGITRFWWSWLPVDFLFLLSLQSLVVPIIFLLPVFTHLIIRRWEVLLNRAGEDRVKVLHEGSAGPRLACMAWNEAQRDLFISLCSSQVTGGGLVPFPHAVTICSRVNISSFCCAQ